MAGCNIADKAPVKEGVGVPPRGSMTPLKLEEGGQLFTLMVKGAGSHVADCGDLRDALGICACVHAPNYNRVEKWRRRTCSVTMPHRGGGAF